MYPISNPAFTKESQRKTWNIHRSDSYRSPKWFVIYVYFLFFLLGVTFLQTTQSTGPNRIDILLGDEKVKQFDQLLLSGSRDQGLDSLTNAPTTNTILSAINSISGNNVSENLCSSNSRVLTNTSPSSRRVVGDTISTSTSANQCIEASDVYRWYRNWL